MTLRVGLLINPIAGLGGEAGLKGTDGMWQEALAKGAQPHATERAQRFVHAATGTGDAAADGAARAGARQAKRPDLAWLTVPGDMGLPGLPTVDLPAKRLGETTDQDTRHAAVALRDAGVHLVCFVGGDGTAADVAAAVDGTVPCLGIPGGVKITSPVFAHDPEEAAWLVDHLVPGFETVLRDVTDLDEDAYRGGRLEVALRGALRVPLSPVVQSGKVPTGEASLDPLVEQALRDWEPEALHIVGAGSVCMALKRRFWGEPTLLGVDAVQGDRIVATDVDGPTLQRLVDAHDGPVRIWLSIIGGQGMLLGRGTQVLRPEVLRRTGWEGIRVLAPPEKLLGVRVLHVDSTDPAFDAEAPSHIRVLAGWNEWRLLRLAHGAPT